MKLGCCALTIKERLKIAWRICGKSCVAEASSYAFLSQVFWGFYFFSLLGIVSAATLGDGRTVTSGAGNQASH